MKNNRLAGPITESLEEGQPYVDEAVKKMVPVYCGKEPMNGHVVRYYKRTPLRWMKPWT